MTFLLSNLLMSEADGDDMLYGLVKRYTGCQRGFNSSSRTPGIVFSAIAALPTDLILRLLSAQQTRQ
jgi:hypothetical protein